jgi:hypothetical protein
MSIEYRHLAERGDAITCRSGGADEERPGLPRIIIGHVEFVLSIGQAAALRDALDRWLIGGEPGDDEQELDR